MKDIKEIEIHVKNMVIEYTELNTPSGKITARNCMQTRPLYRAVSDYIYLASGIKVPANYNPDKQLAKLREKLANAVEEEYEYIEPINHDPIIDNHVSTIISPFDIINRSNSDIISYTNKPTTKEVSPTKQRWRDAPDINSEEVLDKVIVDEVVDDKGHLDLTALQQYVGHNTDILLDPLFRPMMCYNLSYKTKCGKPYTRIHYNILDEIIKLGSMWKLAVSKSYYKNDLMSLIYYIQRDGFVIVCDNRSWNFIILK